MRGFLPEDKVELIKGLTLTADGKGAVFDVSSDELDTFLAGMFLQLFAIDLSRIIPTLKPPSEFASYVHFQETPLSH